MDFGGDFVGGWIDFFDGCVELYVFDVEIVEL